MSGTFSGIETALRSLRTSQAAMDLIGHNAANINTPGYTRQTAIIQATDPASVGSATPGLAQIGTGVDITSIRRVQDMFIDQRLVDARGNQSRNNQAADLLSRTEALVNEPATPGLNDALAGFFNSFQEMSRAPERLDLRTVVLQKAGNLTRQFNNVSYQLSQLDADIVGQSKFAVKQANEIAGQVGDLNRQIRAGTSTNSNVSDLKDRRDELVRSLADLVGARSTDEIGPDGRPTGAVRVSVSGFPIADSSGSFGLPDTLEMSDGVPMLSDGAQQRIPLTGGSVAGMAEARQQLASYRGDLDTTATQLVSMVNALHSTGEGLDGVSGRNFFQGTSAADIAVSSDVKDAPAMIAAASAPLPGQSLAVGDGSNALAISKLIDSKQIGGRTINEFYTSLVSRVGQDAKNAKSLSDGSDKAVQSLDNLRGSVSGVSLDEELGKMLQFQRSYQAASRLLTTVDSMVGELMNVVGR